MSLLTRAFAPRRWSLEDVASYLLFISSLYLAIPHLIFYFGWLKVPLALIAAASLCVGLVATARFVLQFFADGESGVEASIGSSMTTGSDSLAEVVMPQPASKKKAFILTQQHALMIGALCLIWLTISGVGGFASQDNDWVKHNTLLYGLLRKSWPTIFEMYKVDVPLVYYIAYYLPAALVGKVGGWYWANIALFGWSFVGLVIAVLWFCILVRRVSYSVLLLFVVFSGLDYVGLWVVSTFQVLRAGAFDWSHLDSWARIWQYSSNASLMNWVPHQALSGWIVTGMTIYCLVRLRRRDIVLLPFGLSVFWSPFVTLGIVPYLVIDFLTDREPLLQRIRRLFTVPNVAGIVALLITAFYLSSKVYKSSPILIQNLYSGFFLDDYEGSALNAIVFLLAFCLLEFGLYAIVLYSSGAVKDERWRWMLDITVMTLLILPWFKLGVFNDLVMRASIPALFVLAVLVARAVHNSRLSQQAHVALILLLVVGAVTAWVEISRHIMWMAERPAPLYDEKFKPPDFAVYLKSEAFFVGQYAGALESPFYRYAARSHDDGADAGATSNEVELNSHDYLLFGRHAFLVKDALIAPAEVEAGTTFTVPWKVDLFGPAMNGQLIDPTMQLVDAQGIPVWVSTGWPEERPDVKLLTMTKWSGGVSVTVPIRATPGTYALEVGFSMVGSGEYLTAHTVPENEAIGDIVPVATLEVVKPETEAD